MEGKRCLGMALQICEGYTKMLLKVAGSELNLSSSEERPVAVSSEHSVEASRFGLARCQVLREESVPHRDL